VGSSAAGFFYIKGENNMATNWGDVTWNEYGELVLDIYKQPPEAKDDTNNNPKHTYKEIDCGGECGDCVALVVDGVVVSGPPFHPHCKCSLSAEDIENAPEHESNLDNPVGPDRNSEPKDVKWLKDALNKLGFYEPDSRAGETPDDLNEYPNQNLFDGINKFQREHKLHERGIVKPGYQTEAKINNELQHQTKKLEEKGTRDMTNDEKFEKAYNNLKEPEGGYTDGKNQVKDEPTNMGIKQSTMDNYAAQHPESNMPSDVKDLTRAQAREIYKNEYWDNTKIPQIENDRIRNAVFDMNVMGGAGRVVQRALNDFMDAGLSVDGKIGLKTVDALNSIPANKVADFMNMLKAERMEYLQKTSNWPTAQNGWSRRTDKY